MFYSYALYGYKSYGIFVFIFRSSFSFTFQLTFAPFYQKAHPILGIIIMGLTIINVRVLDYPDINY